MNINYILYKKIILFFSHEMALKTRSQSMLGILQWTCSYTTFIFFSLGHPLQYTHRSLFIQGKKVAEFYCLI